MPAGAFEGCRRRSLPAVDDDEALVARVRAGDEQAFTTLVGRHNDAMLRVAAPYVRSWAVAEEVVQDTWLGVIRGIDRFEGRSSFKTWLLQILVNRARTVGVQEQRSVAVSDTGPVVERSRFDATGHWASPPQVWTDVDDRLRAGELAASIRSALDALPTRQRAVVMLRDVEGLSSQEVRDVLEISESNQRVLLHRGRSRLRQALATDFGMI